MLDFKYVYAAMAFHDIEKVAGIMCLNGTPMIIMNDELLDSFFVKCENVYKDTGVTIQVVKLEVGDVIKQFGTVPEKGTH